MNEDKLIEEALQQAKNGREELDNRYMIRLQVAILQQLQELNSRLNEFQVEALKAATTLNGHMKKTSRLTNALRSAE